MHYYTIDRHALAEQSKIKLNHQVDNQAIFKAMAQEMVAIIHHNNQTGQPTLMICPVGPVGHYPYFVDLVNRQGLSLKQTWFINMDEYLDEQDQWIDASHPLSFRGFMDREVYSKIRPDLVMDQDQRIFPDPKNLDRIQAVIDRIGKVDACFGGIGINGHVAFNEPDGQLSNEDFKALNTRVLTIDPMTRAINAVGDLDGAIELMPTRCVTIGMRQILQARQIRLGVFRDWHRAVIRRTALGKASPEFPVSLLQDHEDFCLYVPDQLLDPVNKA